MGAEYRFCPAANEPYENVGCVYAGGTNVTSGTTATDAVAVPAEGVWTLRVALRDAAGNIDRELPATLEPLRLDAQPPSAPSNRSILAILREFNFARAIVCPESIA